MTIKEVPGQPAFLENTRCCENVFMVTNETANKLTRIRLINCRVRNSGENLDAKLGQPFPLTVSTSSAIVVIRKIDS